LIKNKYFWQNIYMAKLLKIIIHPDDRLRKISETVSLEELNSPEFQALLQDMDLTMKKKDGAGLAAPQVGRHLRLIVIADETKSLIMINPRLTKKSWAKVTEEEGCLSVLDDKGEIIYAPVERHKKVNCVYLDAKGNQKKISAEKMLARVIQHEIDHLDGILFVDKIADKKN